MKGKKKRKQVNFYAKETDIRRALILKQPIIVVMYKNVYLNTNKINHSFSTATVSLLLKFEEVFPKVIPNGLPPIKGIKQQINFIVEASIPNTPAYRSNPDETKELQR